MAKEIKWKEIEWLFEIQEHNPLQKTIVLISCYYSLASKNSPQYTACFAMH